jgi:uncharacterized membrane protein (DUF4010 family)
VTVAAVLVIGTRERMHGFVHLIPQDEVLTAGKFLILVGVVLPLAPRYPVDRDLAGDPRHIGLAVAAISGLSYLTYLVQRYRPIKGGAILSALLGGAYSSTVTTVVLAKRASPQRPHTSCERSGRMRLSRPRPLVQPYPTRREGGTPASNT